MVGYFFGICNFGFDLSFLGVEIEKSWEGIDYVGYF